MTTAIPLRNHLSEVGRVAGVVEEFGRTHGIPPDVILCVNLALDEVITNVISYAYDDGGLGIHVVRTVMDTLEYRRERGRNIFGMRKRLTLSGSPEGNT